MNKIETFEQFLATTKGNLGINEFLINLIIGSVLSIILSWIYVKFGRSHSNRKQFASNFIMITLTTAVIISIVKSSLALSLGLVGALSIVRFRTAIKEPEELSYMFLSIAVGLGLGASQIQVTIAGFTLISLIIVLRGLIKRDDIHGNFYISLISENSLLSINEIKGILSNSCLKAHIRKIDEEEHKVEMILSIEVRRGEDIQNLRENLKKLDPAIKFSIFENKGII